MRLNAGRIMERSRSRTQADTSSDDLFNSVPGEGLPPNMEAMCSHCLCNAVVCGGPAVSYMLLEVAE